MPKIKQKEDGNFKATLTQEELNTISLLLGYASDELVKDRAIDNGVKDFANGEKLTTLYNVFYSHRK